MDESIIKKIRNTNRVLPVFRDKDRYLIVAQSYDGLFFQETGHYVTVSRDSPISELGKQALSTFKYVEDNIGVKFTPPTKKAWKTEKKYKSWKEFVRNNYAANLVLDSVEGFYGISVSGKDEIKSHYEVNLYSAKMGISVTPEEFGKGIIDAFDQAEDLYLKSSN